MFVLLQLGRLAVTDTVQALREQLASYMHFGSKADAFQSIPGGLTAFADIKKAGGYLDLPELLGFSLMCDLNLFFWNAEVPENGPTSARDYYQRAGNEHLQALCGESTSLEPAYLVVFCNQHYGLATPGFFFFFLWVWPFVHFFIICPYFANQSSSGPSCFPMVLRTKTWFPSSPPPLFFFFLFFSNHFLFSHTHLHN